MIIAVILFFVFVFSYAAARACLIPITHDEAITYIIHIQTYSYSDIFAYSGEILSNNHLLNTFSIKFLAEHFPVSEYTLRIPALVGLIAFIFSFIKILDEFVDDKLIPCALCLIFLHPFILDLLSMARGYGLALGFFSLSLCSFLVSISTSPGTGNTKS